MFREPRKPETQTHESTYSFKSKLTSLLISIAVSLASKLQLPGLGLKTNLTVEPSTAPMSCGRGNGTRNCSSNRSSSFLHLKPEQPHCFQQSLQRAKSRVTRTLTTNGEQASTISNYCNLPASSSTRILFHGNQPS